ncbi:MAG: cyanophycin synthetase, partial [Bacilli bacterium]
DLKQVNYHLKNNCCIKWIGIDNQDVDILAKNIMVSGKGTTFDICFKGDKTSYHFETKLLGKHNVYNILASVALGKEFGIEISLLQQAVKGVKVIEHRLELKKIGNFYQIDDAYNSNPVGAKNALEVLKLMDGTKIVVTPGMVELGVKEQELNEEFGKEIAEVASKVILIGKKRTKPIKDGLKAACYKEENIIVLNDVREAYPYIQSLKKPNEELYALFENDLPDSYDEN